VQSPLEGVRDHRTRGVACARARSVLHARVVRATLFVVGRVILGAPVLVAWALWAHLGAGAVIVGCAFFTIGVLLGEWLARLVKYLLRTR
jgi:hypothetical protein